jgi:hypothetical protein
MDLDGVADLDVDALGFDGKDLRIAGFQLQAALTVEDTTFQCVMSVIYRNNSPDHDRGANPNSGSDDLSPARPRYSSTGLR